MVAARRRNACYYFYRGCYPPTNGIIANVVLYDFDLNFQGKMRNSNISKTVVVSVKRSDKRGDQEEKSCTEQDEERR